jgi:hypothetical protein
MAHRTRTAHRSQAEVSAGEAAARIVEPWVARANRVLKSTLLDEKVRPADAAKSAERDGAPGKVAKPAAA